jgi:hypothetical protein
MKNVYLLIFVIFVSISCKEKVKSETLLPSFDMQAADNIDFDDRVEDVECVLLENNPSGYMHACWKIIEYDEWYYLYSLDDFCVSIFKRSGEFVRTINNRRQGKLVMPCDIFINRANRQLWIVESQEEIGKYSLDGEFIEQQKLPFQAVKIAQAGKGQYLFYDGGFDRQNPCFLRIASGNDFSESAVFIPKYIRNHTHIPMSFFASGNQSTYLFLPYNDTLYVCTHAEKKVVPCCRLDFHGTFLTHRERPEEGYSMEAEAGMLSENRKITGIRGFHCVNGLLFMKLEGRDYSFRALNLISGRAYRFETLTDGIKTAPQGSTDNSLLISMSARQVMEHYAGRQGKTNYPAVKAMLRQLETASGRVIFKIKLKNKTI